MSQIALIALDLDGTLLNSEKKISPRNRAARAALLRGEIFFSELRRVPSKSSAIKEI